MRFSAKDELSGAVVSTEAAFEVHGHAVEPSSTLVVRNFRFYRTEDDAEPLKLAAYRPGDTIWARFDITGFRLGTGNLRDVAMSCPSAVPVAGPARASEPTDKGSSFYPMKYVPCTISLNLQRDIHPDEYTITVTARSDRESNLRIEADISG
jgi:hypothetical protein